MKLHGTHVVLDTLEREHCQKLWACYEPEIPLPAQRMIPGRSVEGADTWFEEIQSQQGVSVIHLGIFVNDEVIGDVQLSQINWVDRMAHLGGGIALQQHRGKGYGTDAAIALLRFGFTDLNLYRVTANTAQYNVAGQRSLEKVGFTREGTLRECVVLGGKRWDKLLYGMLCQEFFDTHGHSDRTEESFQG